MSVSHRSAVAMLLVWIVASIVAAGADPAVHKPLRLRFSGYTWNVVASTGPRGPGPNVFDPRNVWLDDDGRLVFETRVRDGTWTSAHVFLSRSLGYGRYELVLAAQEKPLDDLTVFGFFTWDDDPAHANREIDIELARWGLPHAPNLNFTVQPAEGRPDRSGLAEFDFSARTTLVLEWLPGLVRFSAESGLGSYSWSYPPDSPPSSDPEAYGVPPTGNERIGLNLWLFQGRSPAAADRVVVESFAFKPCR